MQQLPLCLLSPADHLKHCAALVEVATQLEHLLVTGLVILAVLASLHLLGALSEGDIRVAGGAADALLILNLHKIDLHLTGEEDAGKASSENRTETRHNIKRYINVNI